MQFCRTQCGPIRQSLRQCAFTVFKAWRDLGDNNVAVFEFRVAAADLIERFCYIEPESSEFANCVHRNERYFVVGVERAQPFRARVDAHTKPSAFDFPVFRHRTKPLDAAWLVIRIARQLHAATSFSRARISLSSVLMSD